ncbi:hypothetical protein OS190_06060 [Sulfitobacter sp. F26204]|uniref:hypothetical protein n=1 Tax=Sulfitobacter sp. F26204 TaxID=2996014 RepID=UPI00225E2750|nr:hypothetical protein [Sulfitobacter sp. F26204]MCX7559126.1 hypothetical protein [Sulfitobacter sp. F26204]
MTLSLPAEWPNGAARLQRLGRTVMDVILHLGAHRTATTTFQHYMRDQADALSAQDIEFWGPRRSRDSVFPGLFRNSTAPRGRNVALRAVGRIRMFATQARARGVKQLLISDENLLGNCIQNIRAGRLYPAAGERTARISFAFGGRLRRIVLSIRSQDLWWASACALTVSRGHPVPGAAQFDAILRARRTWRDVIMDLSCAAPGAEIEVLAFETMQGQPEGILRTALGIEAPKDCRGRWLNGSRDLPGLRAGLVDRGQNPDLLPEGTGRWMPFTSEQSAELREQYADDLHWLIAGADGLATLTEESHPTRADPSLPMGAQTKGQMHDQGQFERYMAQHR